MVAQSSQSGKEKVTRIDFYQNIQRALVSAIPVGSSTKAVPHFKSYFKVLKALIHN